MRTRENLGFPGIGDDGIEEENYPGKAIKTQIWNQAGNTPAIAEIPIESHKPNTAMPLP